MDVSTPNASTPQWVEPIGSESYEIGKRLGAGHAVTVYAAVRQRDRQPVAVKFSNDDVSRGSLEEEARLLKRWTDLEKQRRAEGERWHYTPTFCAMRLDQKPCLVVEKVEGYTLASIDERLCAQWNMSREWVALKVGMQLAHVFTFLHGESFHLAYSDLKDDSILWQPDLNAPQNGHIMVLDWNLLYDLQTVADRNVLIAQDLERLNRLVYWLAVGRTLGGYGAVTYDDLERAGGEGWKSLSYGCQELLARALSPLEEHRYHTAQDLHGAYAEIADIWDTTVSHGQFSGQLRNLDQQPLLEETRQWRIACWHSIGLLAHKSEASEARKQEAIEKLHGTQDILGVRSHFQAGRKDAEVLVQKLIDAGRHVLEAKRWQVLFRGVNWEQLSLQDPVREEMIQAMDRLNEGDHEQAEGFLDALSRSHPTWQLDALQQECKFVRTMKAARRKVGPQSEEPLYSQAQEILRTLANRDGEYAKELRRRFGDPQLALQEMRKDRDKREVAAMLQKATAADDISAARSGFLRALAEGAAPSEVIQAIEGRLLTALRGPEPDLRQEPLALASLAMEDPRLTELAYLWQLVRPLAAIQHTLATGKQGELHPILNLLVDRAELAQAASGASVGKRSSEAAQRLLAIARNIAEDSQKWLQGAVAASGDDVLLQILSEGDAFVPKDRQLVEEERQDRARKLEESKRKLERERLEIRAESLSYWQEVSRFAILQTEAALIRRYLDEFERIRRGEHIQRIDGSRQLLRDLVAARRDQQAGIRRQRILQRLERLHAPHVIQHGQHPAVPGQQRADFRRVRLERGALRLFADCIRSPLLEDGVAQQRLAEFRPQFLIEHSAGEELVELRREMLCEHGLAHARRPMHGCGDGGLRPRLE